MHWNKKFECMPLDQLKAFQLKNLKKTVAWVFDKVPFYTRKFKKLGISANDLKHIDDISKLPFTVKNDLRDNYPFGLCALPMDDIIGIHASSGTTGTPITNVYTQADLDQWAECVARNLWAYGVRKKDIVQNAYGYGLFTGGLGLHYGLLKIGCSIIPTSSGITERQVKLLKDFKPTALCSTPSYALTIAEKAEEMNIDIRKLPLKIGIFGAEPWTREMCSAIEERMGITALNIFGLTEMCGPGVGYECSVGQNGSHINEDHFIAEILDTKTFKPVPMGEKGELVFTSIQRQAMPLIRYRTKDITRFIPEKCSCGRTFVKIDRIFGRTDDMLIISGVNIFPSQIESFLFDIKEVDPQYRLIVRKKGYLDKLIVQVEARQEVYDKGEETRKQVEAKINSHIKDNIGISVDVNLVKPKFIGRSLGKAVRVVDER
ncbi:MAG: phenylacetate--CoA ligase [Desulfobacteraceae bacterium 4572_130]|nr:MAG: phenylacetate--CoA ligase [Desulfobacteraceae bacterium 4572_130]